MINDDDYYPKQFQKLFSQTHEILNEGQWFIYTLLYLYDLGGCDIEKIIQFYLQLNILKMK